jgi:8-oxo-dGTP diphosphatase
MEKRPLESPIWYIVNVEGVVFRPADNRYLMIVRGAGEDYLPGALSFPGGKVEGAGFEDDVLESTVRREIREEVGLEIHDDITYVESHSFVGDGEPCVDVVFLCRYMGGEAHPGDPEEVESVIWMIYEEILEHPDVPEWTKKSLKLAEKKRTKLKG